MGGKNILPPAVIDIVHQHMEVIPPPPPQKNNHTVKILLLILLVLVLVIGITATWLYFKNDQNTTKPASTYNAADLVKDFQAAHLKLVSVNYGMSINGWTSNLYNNSVAFTSSATFANLTGCTGACTPQQVGIWVYATTADANSSYQYMVNTTPINGGGYLGVPNATVHGGCLLLGPDSSSTYVEILKDKCI